MEGKLAFERVAESHGVTIKSYQADNGRFAKEKKSRSIVNCCIRSSPFVAWALIIRMGLLNATLVLS